MHSSARDRIPACVGMREFYSVMHKYSRLRLEIGSRGCPATVHQLNNEIPKPKLAKANKKKIKHAIESVSPLSRSLTPSSWPRNPAGWIFQPPMTTFPDFPDNDSHCPAAVNLRTYPKTHLHNRNRMLYPFIVNLILHRCGTAITLITHSLSLSLSLSLSCSSCEWHCRRRKCEPLPSMNSLFVCVDCAVVCV